MKATGIGSLNFFISGAALGQEVKRVTCRPREMRKKGIRELREVFT